MEVVKVLKRAVAGCLFHTGALCLHRALVEKHRSIVLMYHRVNDDSDPFFPSLPRNAFAKQLDYLRENYRIESFEAVMDWVAAGAEGKPRVALTLDDGYPDTYECVLPELRKRELPATLFLATAPPESGQPLWTDRLRHIIKHATRETFSLPAIGLPPLSLANPPDRIQAARTLLGFLKRRGPAMVEPTIADLERQLEPNSPPRRALNWTMVREMAQGPIQIGAHTHRHYILSQLDDDEVRDEIETSVRLIERRVGTQVTVFAYPNGLPGDYDERSIQVLRKMGIRYAVTTRAHFVTPGSNPYQVSRFHTKEPSLPLFAARVAGLGTRKQRGDEELREAVL